MAESLARTCLSALREGTLSVTEIQDAMDDFVDARALSYCIEQLRRQGRLVRANPDARPARYRITDAGEQHLAKPASRRGRPRARVPGGFTGHQLERARFVPNSVFSLATAGVQPA